MRTILVGIDVSARTLNIALDGKGQDISLANTRAGHQHLVRIISGNQQARVALEASGIYSLDLALTLERTPGVEVMVVNPRAARDFAKACLHRSKTDALDARILLDFVRRMPFLPWQPPSAKVLELRAFARRIRVLVKARTQEKNRLHAMRYSRELPVAVLNDIEVNLRHLGRRIKLLERQATAAVRQDSELNQDFLFICNLNSRSGFG